MKASTVDVIKASWVYFILCFTGCCVGNFMAVYLKYRGLTLDEIGIIVGAVYPFSRVIAQPAWGYVADHTGKHKLVMLISLVLGTATVTCLVYCTTFFQLAIVTGVGGALISGTNPMVDNATMLMIKHHGLSSDFYGYTRVFGALGWGVAAPIVGVMVDEFTPTVMLYDFAAFSVLMFISLLINPYYSQVDSIHTSGSDNDSNNSSEHTGQSAVNASADERQPLLQSGAHPSRSNVQAPDGYQVDAISRGKKTQDIAHQSEGNKPAEKTQAAVKRSFWWVICYLLSEKFVLLFMVLTVVMGSFKGAIDSFLFIYLQNMGASGTLLGISLATTTITEFPFFFYSGKLINKLGAVGVTFLSLGAYSIRLLYYAQLTEPWLVLPIELLHGVTFALSWANLVSYAGQVAPKGYSATVQGLFASLFFGIGYGIGGAGGGFISQRWGLDLFFLFASILSSVTIILGMVWYVLEKVFRKPASSTQAGRH